MSGHDADRLDDDLGLRDVLGARGDGLDLVHDVHAGRHLAEDAVADALRRGVAVVQEAVVLHVDEELGRRAVRLGGPRHRDRAERVLEAVRRLVLDRGACRLLVHGRVHAAALNHEVADHAVKDGAVVELVVHVLRGSS